MLPARQESERPEFAAEVHSPVASSLRRRKAEDALARRQIDSVVNLVAVYKALGAS